MNDQYFWLTVSCIKGVGNRAVKELYFQHPYADFSLLEEEKFLETLKPSMRKYLSDKTILQDAYNKALTLKELNEEQNIKVISIADELYPTSLRFIKDPPAILYAKGNLDLLENMDMLAIVGTREPTIAGEKSSKKIASTFATKGYTIVSGLALGIDTAGHEGALRVENGRTIAVMAGDLTKVYPAKNKNLAEEILQKNGLLISEVGVGQSVNKGNFVMRDRIQSGLSLAVCPVQTPRKSGTQHTIQFARDQKRLIFTPIVLDVDLDSNASQGNLDLIKEDGVIVLKDSSVYAEIEQQMQLIKESYQDQTNILLKKERPNYNVEVNYEQGNLF